LGGTGGTAVLLDPSGTRRVITVSKDQAAIGPIDQVGVFGLLQPESLPPIDVASDTSPTPQELLANEARGNLLAVNLCDANESDLRLPKFTQEIAGDPPASGASAWFYLAMLALGLVVGEWVLFNRRVVA